jgi:hypothetical protein
MSSPTLTSTKNDKGKCREVEIEQQTESLSSSGSSSSDTDSSESLSDSDSESEDELITPDYLESLLQKARQNAATRTREASQEGAGGQEEEVIKLPPEPQQGYARQSLFIPSSYQVFHRPLPSLNPGKLPPAYFDLGATRYERSSIRDPDVEQITRDYATPTPPVPPTGTRLTKKEQKAVGILFSFFLVSSLLVTCCM